MTFIDANTDATSIPINAGAAGPRLGFLGGMDAAYESQVRAASMYGLEAAFREVEQEQIRALRRAKITPPKSLNDSEDDDLFSGFTGGINSRSYYEAAKFFEDGGTPEMAAYIEAKNRSIRELQEKHPDLRLRTYGDMWDAVKERARKAERLSSDAPTTLGGDIGSFVGAMAGALDPRTDPLNFITTPLAAGRTAWQRIAVQSGGQGVVEAVNQLTGVQDNRRLLGLDYGLGQAALQIGATAAFGGVFQGAAEGIGYAGRRWFRSTPRDPAPPAPVQREVSPTPPAERYVTLPDEPQIDIPAYRPSLMEDFDTFMREVRAEPQAPYGPSRAAERRTALDHSAVSRQLEDWDGPAPWALKPSTETRPRTDVDGFVYEAPVQRFMDAQRTPEQRAREIDPEAFSIYDKLADKRDRMRGWLVELDTPRNERAVNAVREMDEQLAQLAAKLERTSPKNRKKVQAAIREVQAQRNETWDTLTTSDTPDMARIRSELMAVDQEMRDMAPVISRAYAAAREEFSGHQMDQGALDLMADLETRNFPLREWFPKADVTEPEAIRIPEHAPLTVQDKIPTLTSRPDVTDPMPPTADAADKLSAIIAKEAEQMDEAVEFFRNNIAKLMDGDGEDGTKITINGKVLMLGDEISVPNADGTGARTITVKDYLDEVRKDNDALQSVTSCSAPKIS